MRAPGSLPSHARFRVHVLRAFARAGEGFASKAGAARARAVARPMHLWRAFAEAAMLDLDKADLPRSGARSRQRWTIASGLAAVAVLSVVFVFPELLPARLRGQQEKQEPLLKPASVWVYGGDEPAARKWAAPLEAALARVCRDAYAHMAGPNYMSAFIAHRLFAAERKAASAESRKPRWRKLSPEEDADAVGSIGGEQQFTGTCLRWSYAALSGCAQHAADLGGQQAASCMLPPVNRANLVEPWLLCAKAARLEQVRKSCEEVAALMAKWEDEGRPVQ
jgi:hypothetical protein